MDLQTARRKWFAHGTVGVLLVGAGISVLFDAAYRRLSESVVEIWVAEGTLGFVLFMAGLSFFGSAVRYMVHMDRMMEYADRRARRHMKDRRRESRKLRLETDDAEIQVRSRKGHGPVPLEA